MRLIIISHPFFKIVPEVNGWGTTKQFMYLCIFFLTTNNNENNIIDHYNNTDNSLGFDMLVAP